MNNYYGRHQESSRCNVLPTSAAMLVCSAAGVIAGRCTAQLLVTELAGVTAGLGVGVGACGVAGALLGQCTPPALAAAAAAAGAACGIGIGLAFKA
jgi:hypothetical protein